MTDFAALIDRVILREARSNLATFLASYRLADGGRTRKPRPEELALISSAMTDYVSKDRTADRAMAEVGSLCNRLNEIAAQEGLGTTTQGVRIRNACFDALACIKRLEAGLTRHTDQSAITRPRAARLLSAANDS